MHRFPGMEDDDFWDHFSELDNLHEAMVNAWDGMLCAVYGHDWVDRGYGGPDSGCDDKECRRCGKYWSIPLY